MVATRSVIHLHHRQSEWLWTCGQIKDLRNEKTWCEKEHVLREGFDEIEVNGGSMDAVEKRIILYGYQPACEVRQ